MSQSRPLVEFLRALTRDGGLRAEFSADPPGVLAANGVGRASPREIHDALVRIREDAELGGFDRGRDPESRQVPPPPPPEYFADHDAAGYLDNYVAGGFEPDGGAFGAAEPPGAEPPVAGAGPPPGTPGLPPLEHGFHEGTDVTAVDLGADHGTGLDHGTDSGHDPGAGHDLGGDHGAFGF